MSFRLLMNPSLLSSIASIWHLDCIAAQMILLRILFLLLLSFCAPSLKDLTTQGANSNSSPPTDNPLTVVFIDVGQGDSTLLITPSGETILIDVGNPMGGGESVYRTIKEHDIEKIDAIYLTHYDADHSGGIFDVILGPDHQKNTEDDLPVDQIFDRGPGGTPSFSDSYQKTFGELRQTLHAGDIKETEDGVTVECIAANGKLSNGEQIKIDEDAENDHGIALLVTYQGNRLLFTGDLAGYEEEGYTDMESPVGKITGPVDLWHGGHHGSANSSSLEFLEMIRPETVVISVGNNNSYHHPHPDALTRILSVGAKIYQTEKGYGIEDSRIFVKEDNIMMTVTNQGVWEF